jgi:4-carboxymuconolactone decarboxylase
MLPYRSGLPEQCTRISFMAPKNLVESTKQTAAKLFSGPVDVEVPYQLWKAFDPELAKDLSLFITGNLYSREVLPLAERQVVAVTALAALHKTEELKIHLHGALNVGVPAAKLAEAIFQLGVYAGFPVVNAALAAFKEVLTARNQWPLQRMTAPPPQP